MDIVIVKDMFSINVKSFNCKDNFLKYELRYWGAG